MNKEEYLKELRKNLKRLPEQEINDALEYYTEYLEEAGPENEAAILEELGSPKDLARKIIIEAVDKEFIKEDSDDESSESSDNSDKKSKHSLWIVLLAVLAIPMSPVVVILLLALLIVIFVILITLFAVVFAFGVAALAGLLSFILGIILIFINPGIGLVTIGAGLIIASVFTLLTVGTVKLTGLTIRGVKHLCGSIVHKKAGKKS